ncbi:NAD(P)/FAD-dependent oxidoreductase [Angustibacter sp. Root456]|uniref:dihydrolipoyl dehydrogenase family protein n=1 Tax=Angustibacter sp. Root456 TaxID=1736539 RepID=UPI000700CC5F|nr:NAD(P)/FAD-dependent oxidoreductase [Angustibacter sp. Root456]KQX66266.1 pyridine nucleotide-disulfide oxidoreductase [Angustibacter sp. Root456]
MSDQRSADVIVIGLGPGGEDVAGRLAEAGLDVIAVDRGLVGGECPYWGCIPSKMMIRAANALAEAARAREVAGDVGDIKPRWQLVADRIRDEATDDWDDTVAVERLQGKGARFVRGHGSIERRQDDGGLVVSVEGTEYVARKAVVVATGTTPAVPPIEGIGDVDYWTNHGFVEARELPDSLVVLGGGAIGCELAQVAARFGVRVTVVEKAPRLLAVEEPRASELVEQALRDDGIDVRTGVGATHVEAHGTGGAVRLRLDDGSELTADRLLVASGRRVDVRAAGLHTVGVDPDARAVPVDEWGRVTDGVWALGDIVGHGAFTHMSMYEADVVVRDVLGQGGPAASYDAIPRVTFTDPEIGAVGLTEAQARERFSNVRVGSVDVATTTRGWIHGPGGAGFISVVEDADRGVLVGATSAGPTGGEVLGFLALAVSAQVPVQQMIDMPYAYPTIHRGIQNALKDLGS